ncbi:MAG: metal-dependent hydrolase [Pseudomonadota bacterium]
MITAHLPAGYLTGRAFAIAGPTLWAAVLGGILPDFDLIWFYLIDDRAFHHHHYLVHVPAFWAAIALVVFPLIRVFQPRWTWPAIAFFAALFVHICLDAIAGGIKWFWPFSNELFYIVTVEAVQRHWLLNFIIHPIFLLEIAIWIAAFVVWHRTRRARQRKA